MAADSCSTSCDFHALELTLRAVQQAVHGESFACADVRQLADACAWVDDLPRCIRSMACTVVQQLVVA